uniref:Uncharacterized protein n=1 Tax=Lepeophtheirus salmonis TaxID=72036 RepID=A0A0K2TEV8_LEPSM
MKRREKRHLREFLFIVKNIDKYKIKYLINVYHCTCMEKTIRDS